MSRTGWVRDTTPLLRICVLPEAGARWLDSERLRERIWNMLGVGRREEGVPHAPVLRIGLCVLGRHAKTQFEATGVLDEANRIHGFRATGVVWDGGSQGSVEAELQACVAWAHEARIHVLCFPELALDEDGRNALRREIERDPGSLCVIFPGSFHEPDPEPKRTIGWVNRARIWAVHAGATPEVVELGGFEKTEPFTMSPEHVGDAIHNHDPDSGCLGYREHIDPGDQIVIVPTPVGRFGIAICRDSFRPNLMSRYAPVVDHLVVISMNEARTDWFWSTSEDLARRSFAASYYVNSTQFVGAYDTTVDLAFFCFPKGTVDQNVVYYGRQPAAAPWRRAKTQAIGDDRRVYAAIPIPRTLFPS